MKELSDNKAHGLWHKTVVIQMVKKFPAFMEPYCPLPCSQEHTTELYSE
jgi:hypothetical protein